MAIEKIAIVGSGFLGAKITLRSAMKGYSASMYDIDQDALTRAKENQENELSTRIDNKTLDEQEKKRIQRRIRSTTNLIEAVSDADLVIEAIPERLELKKKIFKEIDKASPAHTIIATNSSSIRVSLIEDACERPEKVLNLHFYDPLQETTMVDIMRGTKTSDNTVEQVIEYVKGLGITPLLVQKESTGFLFNRVWRAIKKETLHLVDDGVGSFEDVDRAWMIMFDKPVGPFGMMDRIGLDVVRDIEMVYYNESSDESDYPPRLLLDRVERGDLGVKTGKGFYTYPNPAYDDPDWLKG
jgi:3-hydroxybutyryl-CoA dehydrogenase